MKNIIIFIFFSSFINLILNAPKEDEKYTNTIFDLFTEFLFGMSRKNKSECVNILKFQNINKEYKVSNNKKVIKDMIKYTLENYSPFYNNNNTNNTNDNDIITYLGKVVKRFGLEFFSIKRLGERCRYIHAFKAFYDHNKPLNFSENLATYLKDKNNAKLLYTNLIKNGTDIKNRFRIFGETFSEFLNFTVY